MECLCCVNFQHKPMSEITSGLHRGIYHQGKLRVNRYNPFEAYVGRESIGDEIVIYGRSNMNRAFDGDIVAAELLPQDQWQEVSSLSIAGEGTLIVRLFVVWHESDLSLVRIYSLQS